MAVMASPLYGIVAGIPPMAALTAAASSTAGVAGQQPMRPASLLSMPNPAKDEWTRCASRGRTTSVDVPSDSNRDSLRPTSAMSGKSSRRRDRRLAHGEVGEEVFLARDGRHRGCSTAAAPRQGISTAGRRPEGDLNLLGLGWRLEERVFLEAEQLHAVRLAGNWRRPVSSLNALVVAHPLDDDAVLGARSSSMRRLNCSRAAADGTDHREQAAAPTSAGWPPEWFLR